MQAEDRSVRGVRGRPREVRPGATPDAVSDAMVDEVRHCLYAWWNERARDLPWRFGRTTPWGVLVSEVMSQQTPMSRVVPYWLSWMRSWPDAHSLAQASTAEVITAWGRLGYPRRALHLQECARVLVQRHQGELPHTYEELVALPGIGDYTASAVLSFAYGQRIAVIDTNVRRVLSRVFLGRESVGGSASCAERALAQAVLPCDGEPGALGDGGRDGGARQCDHDRGGVREADARAKGACAQDVGVRGARMESRVDGDAVRGLSGGGMDRCSCVGVQGSGVSAGRGMDDRCAGSDSVSSHTGGCDMPAPAMSSFSFSTASSSPSFSSSSTAISPPSSLWNQSVMELGAVVCTARQPACAQCPIAGQCAFRDAGLPGLAQGRTRPRQRFAGTDRQVRGVVLQALRTAPQQRIGRTVVESLWGDGVQLDACIASLDEDGLIEMLPDGGVRLPR